MDYQNEIDKFYASNRYRDEYFDFQEERKIPDLVHHNLIRLGKNDPILSKYFFFYIINIVNFIRILQIIF